MSRAMRSSVKAAVLLALPLLQGCVTLPPDRPVWQRDACTMPAKADGVGYANQHNLMKMLERKEDRCKGQRLAPAQAGPAVQAIDKLVSSPAEGQAPAAGAPAMGAQPNNATGGQ